MVWPHPRRTSRGFPRLPHSQPLGGRALHIPARLAHRQAQAHPGRPLSPCLVHNMSHGACQPALGSALVLGTSSPAPGQDFGSAAGPGCPPAEAARPRQLCAFTALCLGSNSLCPVRAITWCSRRPTAQPLAQHTVPLGWRCPPTWTPLWCASHGEQRETGTPLRTSYCSRRCCEIKGIFVSTIFILKLYQHRSKQAHYFSVRISQPCALPRGIPAWGC